MDFATVQSQVKPQRYTAVQNEIESACREAGRDPRDVALVTVTKTADQSAIEPVLGAGQRLFGENRVQEAKSKWPALLERCPDIELHLIGPLQSNKVKDAVALFHAIQTVDRPKLCDALAKEMDKQGRRPLLMVQVNTGCEPQKAGVLPDDADSFLKVCRDTYAFEIEGLMCIPPFHEPPSRHFELTATIARRNGLKFLSMGMSADFAVAIRHGATHVRVGQAIFGPRPSVAYP